MSSLFLALLAVIVVGSIIIWIIPDASVKALAIKVLTVVVIVLLLGWVLQFFGIWHFPAKV